MYPNLKLQIWRSGIRQNHLARLLKVDESILSRMINGFRKPTPELKTRIATVLKAEEAWLFEEAEADRMVSGLQ
jgi:transcriptional regulator with XRE-family HTH domain